MNQFIHRGKDKKKFVREMFDDISSSYDFLNKLLSLGVDSRWRKKFIDQIRLKDNNRVLDLATGTGDVPLTLASDNRIKFIDGICYGFLALEDLFIMKKRLN